MSQLGLGRLGPLSKLRLGAAAPSTGVGVPVLQFAPVNDQPIITGAAGTPVFATQTPHTLKRLGDDTTAVDIAGDPKFRYPGVPAGVLVPAPINARVVSSVLPGGVAQGRRWDHAIEFETQSKFVALVAQVTNASPRWLVSVNGKWISESFTTAASAGATSHILMEFPDRAPRKIKIMTNGGSAVINLQTEAAHPPVRSVSPGKVLLTIGDSLSAGANGIDALQVWPQAIAAMLGFDHCCNASIGGTRWVQSGTGDVAISHFGGDRLPLGLATSPEAVVFAGSRNDAASNQAQLDQISAAVIAALDAASVSKKFVMGTFTDLPQNAAVRSGAEARSVPFVNMTDGLLPEDISGDFVHPTLQGAINLRNRIAPRLFAAGCRP